MKKVYAGLAISMTLMMLIAAGISYQQVTATYQNFRLTHRRYRHPSGHLHLSRTLTINDWHEQKNAGYFSAQLSITATKAQELIFSNWYLYEGQQTPVNQIVTGQINGKDSNHLKQGKNQISIKTEIDPAAKPYFLVIVTNPKHGHYQRLDLYPHE